MSKCQYCGNENRLEIHKYCSRKCSFAVRKGAARPEHGAKVSSKIKGHEVSNETREKISKANTKVLPDNVLQQFKEILNWGYVSHYEAMKTHLGVKLSQRVFARLYKELKPSSGLTFLPVEIQKWPKEKWDALCSDAKELEGLAILEKYEISTKTLRRILLYLGETWIRRQLGGIRKETIPERIVKDFLESNKIDFQNEWNLGKYYFDIRIDNVLIEVNGDFWHCNPSVYDEPVHKIQKDNLINDARKLQYAQQCGFRVIYVWEFDLNHFREETLNDLLGVLRDERNARSPFCRDGIQLGVDGD